MIGKYTLKSYTYQQFTRAIRRKIPDATSKESYRRWTHDELNIPRSASRILYNRKRRKAK